MLNDTSREATKMNRCEWFELEKPPFQLPTCIASKEFKCRILPIVIPRTAKGRYLKMRQLEYMSEENMTSYITDTENAIIYARNGLLR